MITNKYPYPRRVAKVPISPDLVRERLCMPPTAVILGVELTDAGEIEFIVEDPSLPEVMTGGCIPRTLYSIRRNVPEEFCGWTINETAGEKLSR